MQKIRKNDNHITDKSYGYTSDITNSEKRIVFMNDKISLRIYAFYVKMYAV